MITGLKTVIWCCANYRQPKPGQAGAPGVSAAAAAAAAAAGGTGSVHPNTSGGPSGTPGSVVAVPPRRPMAMEERDHTAKFFKWALPCLRVFTRSGASSQSEWKEALDHFAGAFTVLDPFDLRTTV
ncbi:unnamed protein product, partial [Discosporangium mesarthrocarpum]